MKRIARKIRGWTAAFACFVVILLLLRCIAALAAEGGAAGSLHGVEAGARWRLLPPVDSWQAAGGLLPASLLLYAFVLVAVCGFGLPLGILWGGLRTGLLRGAAGLLALLLAAIPGLFLAYVFLWCGAVVLDVPLLRPAHSPPGTDADPWKRAAMELWLILMPAGVLAVPAIGKVAGEMQREVARNMRGPSMVALQSRGLSRGRRLYRYALPASWGAALRSLGAAFPMVIGASLPVEWIFGYPGLGARSFEAVRQGEADFLFAVLSLLGAIVLAGRAALDVMESLLFGESEEA